MGPYGLQMAAAGGGGGGGGGGGLQGTRRKNTRNTIVGGNIHLGGALVLVYNSARRDAGATAECVSGKHDSGKRALFPLRAREN